MRFTRWWNPSLPQTLGIAVILLYIRAVEGLLALVGFPLGGSAYAFLGYLIFGHSRSSILDNHVQGVMTLVIFVASLAYGYAGIAIANSQKVGWKVGVVVAAGAVVIPLLAVGLGPLVASTYVIGYLFDIALVALLVHPEGRNYQRIWFDGPVKRKRR